ncbi:MAG: hypothetical protein DLM64_02450 [Solirubrobacterales bacterium]|nr:MAG: hypothetical protein DLM64_02450 [Solirubrobacterales bacterium]
MIWFGRRIDAPDAVVLDGVAGFIEDPSFYPYLSERANLARRGRRGGGACAPRRGRQPGPARGHGGSPASGDHAAFNNLTLRQQRLLGRACRPAPARDRPQLSPPGRLQPGTR